MISNDMCSIIAYKGNNRAAPILVNSLKKMEYRGYDSVGIATIANNRIMIRKGVGKVEEVNKLIGLDSMDGNIGIGHTRWATHGGITDYNAHPHYSCNREIAIVHNGKIENYLELKELLKDHKFNSETDSEVIAHLIEENLKYKDLKNAILDTCKSIKGAYAFVAMLNDGVIVGARRNEPLLIGVGNEEYYIASDVLGFIEYTDQVIFLDNNEFVIIDKDLKIYDENGREVKKVKTQIAWEFVNIDKGNYAYYTLKEINEQVYTIPRVFGLSYNLDELKYFMLNAKRIILVGSGSSYNASLLAKSLFSKIGLNCESIIASESQYYKDLFDENTLLIAVSQSGETKDVLRAVKYAKDNNSKVVAILNVKTSSLARESHMYLSIDCGPEIGVAATKSFTAQLALFYRIANYIEPKKVNFKLDDLASSIKQVLSINIDKIVEDIKGVSDVYILGRGLHYPIALEGALKIKELAYVHAEGMAAGEFRHGPLALIDKNSLVIMINPQDYTYNDTYSNVLEIKARNGKIIGISDVESKDYDWFIRIPKVDSLIYPLIEVIPLQLLAYNLALKKDYNPDYPRNLAKSVTVD